MRARGRRDDQPAPSARRHEHLLRPPLFGRLEQEGAPDLGQVFEAGARVDDRLHEVGLVVERDQVGADLETPAGEPAGERLARTGVGEVLGLDLPRQPAGVAPVALADLLLELLGDREALLQDAAQQLENQRSIDPCRSSEA